MRSFPTILAWNRTVTVFTQALAGATRFSFNVDTCGSLPQAVCSEVMATGHSADSFFSVQPAAGIDVHEFRFTTGVVVGFGKR